MRKYIFFVVMFSIISGFGVILPAAFNIAILGLGGRCHYVLLDCLKLNNDINVVAVCDDHAQESLDFFVQKLEKENNSLKDTYKQSFKSMCVYADTEDGLSKLFENHANLDCVFITSANYKHAMHLNAVAAHSSCTQVYMEKPMFRTLEEYNNFDFKHNDLNILVGLTLRYSSMAKIVAETLQQYKNQLGTLKSVKAWERVRFCQALTSFMMCWRRYISLSGGFLLEKSIHDLDLALFFIKALNIQPFEIEVTTQVAHNFFKQSNMAAILHEIEQNEALKKTLVGRELSPFQRLIPFSFDQHNNIDWSKTIADIFADLPADDNFEGSDIIPDYHKLNAVIATSDDTKINFELEVELGGYRPTTKRGMEFTFEHGIITIDVMASSMVVTLDHGTTELIDLLTNNFDHADGDIFIAQSILGNVAEGYHVATINDPIVDLANVMGLVSERQALSKEETICEIKKPIF